MSMELSTLLQLVTSQESLGTAALVLLWQMKRDFRLEMSGIKKAVIDLTEKMARHEDEQDKRWADHEMRLKRIEEEKK